VIAEIGGTASIRLCVDAIAVPDNPRQALEAINAVS
jgi:hypothetical protein